MLCIGYKFEQRFIVLSSETNLCCLWILQTVIGCHPNTQIRIEADRPPENPFWYQNRDNEEHIHVFYACYYQIRKGGDHFYVE